MTMRELNAYRKAGRKQRTSVRMRGIREGLNKILFRLQTKEDAAEWCRLIELRYIQARSIQITCMEMHISERTYFRLLKKIKAYIEY